MGDKLKHDPDWWLIKELSEDDPWDCIAIDFQNSAEILLTLRAEKFSHGPVVIGGTPEFRSPEERIEFAFSLAMNLQQDIASKISEKKTDEEFTWLWGEYQKAVSILQSAYPEYQGQQPMTQSSVARGQKKKQARQWYVLWFEWYKRSPESKYTTRKAFEANFEDFLQELRFERISFVGFAKTHTGSTI